MAVLDLWNASQRWLDLLSYRESSSLRAPAIDQVIWITRDICKWSKQARRLCVPVCKGALMR